MNFKLRETDRHFLMSLVGATGIILFWRGLWGGIDSFTNFSSPFLQIFASPWVSLFFGLVILTFTGLIFAQFDPLGGIEGGVMSAVQKVANHPRKHEFIIKYYDKLQKKDVEISAKNIRQIEKNILLIHEKGKEVFIPLHRVKSIHRFGKTIWRL